MTKLEALKATSSDPSTNVANILIEGRDELAKKNMEVNLLWNVCCFVDGKV